eukprot:7385934-Prymnesium_polylepis.1
MCIRDRHTSHRCSNNSLHQQHNMHIQCTCTCACTCACGLFQSRGHSDPPHCPHLPSHQAVEANPQAGRNVAFQMDSSTGGAGLRLDGTRRGDGRQTCP